MTAPEIDELRAAFLTRHNINWEPDAEYLRNVDHAMAEAAAHIRSIAANPELSLIGDSIRGLVIECAWYCMEHRKPEFDSDYRSDLLFLRLTEGFGCGKNRENLV